MPEQIIEANGLVLEIDLQGAVGPLVVLEPAIGRGAADFSDLSSALVRSGYRAAAVNPRGAGRSRGPLEGLTLHDLAADLARIIEALQGAPAAVIGHAFGNRVVRCLGADRPELVKCLVLLAAGGRVPPSPECLAAMAILRSPEATEAERRAALKKAFFAQNSSPDPWLTGNWPESRRARGEAGRATPLEDWWSGGQASILVIQGLEDINALPANGRQLKETHGARVTLEEIPNAAHNLLHEQPEAISAKIIDYLNRQFQRK
jgi:pimeloyl-ACP methyl ester carboxylesterase